MGITCKSLIFNTKQLLLLVFVVVVFSNSYSHSIHGPEKKNPPAKKWICLDKCHIFNPHFCIFLKIWNFELHGFYWSVAILNVTVVCSVRFLYQSGVITPLHLTVNLIGHCDSTASRLISYLDQNTHSWTLYTPLSFQPTHPVLTTGDKVHIILD